VDFEFASWPAYPTAPLSTPLPCIQRGECCMDEACQQAALLSIPGKLEASQHNSFPEACNGNDALGPEQCDTTEEPHQQKSLCSEWGDAGKAPPQRHHHPQDHDAGARGAWDQPLRIKTGGESPGSPGGALPGMSSVQLASRSSQEMSPCHQPQWTEKCSADAGSPSSPAGALIRSFHALSTGERCCPAETSDLPAAKTGQRTHGSGQAMEVSEAREAELQSSSDREPLMRVVSPALVFWPLPEPLGQHLHKFQCLACHAGDAETLEKHNRASDARLPRSAAHALSVEALHMQTIAMASGAHGSTPAARLDAHGTYEFSAFSPLKGCWPSRADDVVGLFWSLTSAHLPRCLWWGGLHFSALLFDKSGELQVPMTMREEADLIAYAQARSPLLSVHSCAHHGLYYQWLCCYYLMLVLSNVMRATKPLLPLSNVCRGCFRESMQILQSGDFGMKAGGRSSDLVGSAIHTLSDAITPY
jgi:hypothetical protein